MISGLFVAFWPEEQSRCMYVTRKTGLGNFALTKDKIQE